MKRLDWLLILLAIICYIFALILVKPLMFNYSFKSSLIERYKHSQDIIYDVPNRVFLSDSDIHIAAGYLYITGENPIAYNFQHPPFIKYLFGISILLFKTPYVIQLLFGCLLLVGTYVLGRKLTGNIAIAFIASLMLSFDPLFLDLSSQALLDLGQSVFALIYTYIAFFHPSLWLLQGIVLGLFTASKFWSTALFFIALPFVYRLIKREKLEIMRSLKMFLVAGITFSLTYIMTFIYHKGMFNIVFFQLKTLKYWFQHSISSIPGASLILFSTGYFKSWWGNNEFMRADIWSPLWPVGLVSSVSLAVQSVIKKSITKKTALFALPLLYLMYLGLQAAFPRYFILILPYVYIAFSYYVVSVGGVAVKKLFGIIKR